MFSKAWLAVAAAGALALVAGCGPSKAPAPSAAPKVSAADQAGAKLYVEYACVWCHGVRGDGKATLANGKATGAPPLSGTPADTVKQYLGKSLPPSQGHILSMSSTVSGLAVNDGTINMPYWYPFLSSKQTDELATYIADGLPKVPGVSGKPMAATTGKEIYASFACVKCHGQFDVGGVVNPGAIKGHGDHLIPTLGPKGLAKAIAKWNAPFKTKAANPGYYKYNPTITTASVTGKQFIENKLLLGSIIHDGVIGGAPGAIFMPAWGQLMTPTQLNTIVQYLKTGQ
ncbi:MAG: c-type cytochrome [Thermaerobacter sp.]|nr:c-type cytochrome [Thermaerobacter sp.]